MSGINKVILIGNLGKDPETRYMPSGKAATNFTVATSERFKDRETGEPQERTEWHRISTFDRLAEIAAEYLKKGSKVYIEGRLRTRKWQDKEGKDRTTTEIVADQLQMLDARGMGSASGAGSGGVVPVARVEIFGVRPPVEVTNRRSQFLRQPELPRIRQSLTTTSLSDLLT